MTTLPDDVDLERIPDGVDVLRTVHKPGTCNNVHLFADCQALNEAVDVEPARLGDGYAPRENVCGHCLGQSRPDPALINPKRHIGSLEELYPRDVGLEPVEKFDQAVRERDRRRAGADNAADRRGGLGD